MVRSIDFNGSRQEKTQSFDTQFIRKNAIFACRHDYQQPAFKGAGLTFWFGKCFQNTLSYQGSPVYLTTHQINEIASMHCVKGQQQPAVLAQLPGDYCHQGIHLKKSQLMLKTAIQHTWSRQIG